MEGMTDKQAHKELATLVRFFWTNDYIDNPKAWNEAIQREFELYEFIHNQ